MNKKIWILVISLLLSFSFSLIGQATRLAPVEVDFSRDGYINPGSKMKRGEVLFISPDEIEIKTNTEREKYRLTPSTIYIKRGQMVNINTIKEGDKILLFFDSIYTTEVSVVQIEDEETHISGVLKGRIDMVDTISGEIWIKKPLEYKDSKWINTLKYSIKLKSAGDSIYRGNTEISLEQLKLFTGKEVYIAYDTRYGKYNIAKLRTKNGYAKEYNGKVFSIEYNTGQMVVSNNLMGLDEGTIVIKDNRLVDNLNIDRGREIDLIVERNRGKNISSIISMDTDVLEERIDDTDIYVYRGKIEDIYDYEIEIGKIDYRKNYLKLEKMKWKEIEDTRRFFFSSDSLVYDSELKKIIDPIYLWNSRFINIQDIQDKDLKDRIKTNYYKGKQAYFVTRESEYGREVIGINLIPYKNYYGGNVMLNHSINGEISEIDYTNKIIKLDGVKSYNNLNSTWERTANQTIDINKSVVILNDIAIPLEEIHNIRIGSKAHIIKEKTSSVDEAYVILIED